MQFSVFYSVAAFSLFWAFYLGALVFGLLSLGRTAVEVFVGGVLIGVFVVALFSWLFYKSYTSRISDVPALSD